MTNDNQEVPIFLITSSERKHDHLSFLSEKTGLKREYGVKLYRLPWEYEEVQSPDDMRHLLREALERSRFNEIRDTFFIIEQTSVFLDAKGGERPGQLFKQWWQETTPEDLREIVVNDPGATIESGLALNVPNHSPILFTNRQRGEVTLDGSIRDGNEKYSWLSKKDFNYYFRPSGANKVYNEMDTREFKKYDFRRPQFEKISTRIGEYLSILKSETTIESLNKAADELRPQLELTEEPSFSTSSSQTKLQGDFIESDE